MSTSREVKVAFAQNQPEAELIQGILREANIPSVVKRNAGFDVPDFLAAGPRDIYVLAEAKEKAIELLRETTLNQATSEVKPGAPPWVVLAVLLAGLAVIILIGLISGQ